MSVRMFLCVLPLKCNIIHLTGEVLANLRKTATWGLYSPLSGSNTQIILAAIDFLKLCPSKWDLQAFNNNDNYRNKYVQCLLHARCYDNGLTCTIVFGHDSQPDYVWCYYSHTTDENLRLREMRNFPRVIINGRARVQTPRIVDISANKRPSARGSMTKVQ